MAQMMVALSDADLLARMRNFEDHFVERKTVRDEKDWKKTAVAFANSAPIGMPAVLYIGVRNNGEIETPQHNLDEAQRTFNSQMKRVYPEIAYVPKIINTDGKQALAVIIPGSASRPHFAGRSYVRKGSESVEASEGQFLELIAQRNSKAAHILKWSGQPITVKNRSVSGSHVNETNWADPTIVIDCNQFYVTLRQGNNPVESFPLGRITISSDNMRNRLALYVAP